MFQRLAAAAEQATVKVSEQDATADQEADPISAAPSETEHQAKEAQAVLARHRPRIMELAAVEEKPLLEQLAQVQEAATEAPAVNGRPRAAPFTLEAAAAAHTQEQKAAVEVAAEAQLAQLEQPETQGQPTRAAAAVELHRKTRHLSQTSTAATAAKASSSSGI